MTVAAVAAPLTLTLRDLVAATGGQVTSTAAGAEPLSGVSIDSRTLSAGQVFFAIHGPRFDGHEFLHDAMARGASAAVVHREAASPPGLPLVRVADTTRALADLARHVRRAASIPVAVITGSAGKTTTKEMTAALLATRGSVLKTEGNLNNQYGLPLTLMRLDADHAFAVLELGMSSAGELRVLSGIAEPDIAVITNVGPAHLEFFSSVDAIAAAKAEVFEGTRPGGLAVLNGDDVRLRRIGPGLRQRVVWFGRNGGNDVAALHCRETPFGTRFDLRLEGKNVDVALPLAGPHFVMDFLAAAAVAHALGVSPEAIATAATSLRAVRHRGDVRRLGQGLTLIDDSYNSSPPAVAAALAALSLLGPRRRVAILGDMLELGPPGLELHRIAGARAAGSADVLVAVGALAPGFLEGARRAGMPESALVSFPDAAAAAAVALLLAPGDAVLVKGSRGIHLESVVEAIVARFGEGGKLMLFHLLYALRHEVSGLNVVRYITFRTAVASLTALFLVLVLGPWMIERLRRLQIGQFIREEGPKTHMAKAGTPTMGGVLILVGILTPTLLWADLTNRNVRIAMLSTFAFGAVGFADDYIKVVQKRSLGLTVRVKLLCQITIGLTVGTTVFLFSLTDPREYSTRLVFPFLKQVVPDLGLFYLVFAVLLLSLSSNAVNLTDGLDGLAIGTTLIAAAAFTGLAYVSGHRVFSNYLDLIFLPSAGEVTVFCGAMVGASMGFLWWNCYPAEVFMGDVGSLSLGGALGTVAVLIKQELLLLFVGGLFMVEALSVILQVGSFKLRGKRIFRMAPLHHHFELVGWKEPQIIIRFWIVAFVFALFSLTTLKLR